MQRGKKYIKTICQAFSAGNFFSTSKQKEFGEARNQFSVFRDMKVYKVYNVCKV